MGITAATIVVILALLPISHVLGGTTTTSATTTTDSATTTESTTAAQTGSGQSNRTEAEASGADAAVPCPGGVYDSTAGTVTFQLTDAQCDVIIQLDKPKKGKKSGPKKPKKGGKNEPKSPKKPKKGGKKKPKGKKTKPGRQKRRGKKPKKGKGQSKDVRVVSRATGEEGASECPQARTESVSKRGFIVDVGKCELIAIGKDRKKGSKELAPIIFSRTREA